MPIYKFGPFNVDSEIELDLSQILEVPVRARVIIIDDPGQAALSSAKLVCEVSGIGQWWISSDCSLILVKALSIPSDVRIRDITCRVLARCLGSAHDILVIHAAAVCQHGQATVLVGRPGAGKSTLACGLSKLGYEVLSDDNVLLFDCGGQIKTCRSTNTVRLSDHSLSVLGLAQNWPRIMDKNLVSIGSTLTEEMFPVCSIALLSDDSRSNSFRVGPQDAVFEIVQSLWNWQYGSGQINQAQLSLIARLVNTVPVVRVESRQSARDVLGFLGQFQNTELVGGI